MSLFLKLIIVPLCMLLKNEVLGDTKIMAEAKHPINFTQSKKRLVLRINYNGSNSFLFVNTTKIH